MAEKKKIPVPAPEAVPLHRPEVDAAPILPEPQTPPPPPGPVYGGLVPFFHLAKNPGPGAGARPAAAPPAPAAVTVYCTRLSPCTHTPQPLPAVLSLPADTCTDAVGAIDGGT